MPSLRALAPALVSLGLLVPPAARAQELSLITGALKDMHSIAIAGTAATLRKSSELSGGSTGCAVASICGFGAELLFDLSETPHIELGVGVSYLQPLAFRARSGGVQEPSLYASLRSLPTVSLYYSDIRGTGFYLGGGIGFSELWNAQIYAHPRDTVLGRAPDTIPGGPPGDTLRDTVRTRIALEGSALDVGAIAGFAQEIGSIALFVEAAHRWRNFGSLKYDPGAAIPQRWPRTLELTGFQFAAGVQLRIKKEDPSPPTLAERLKKEWRLQQVDDVNPPYVVEIRNASGGWVRDEVTAGRLVFRDVAGIPSFRIELFGVEVTRDASGDTKTTPKSFEPITGAYRIDSDGRLWMTQAGAGDLGASAQGNRITLRLPRLGRFLTFQQP